MKCSTVFLISILTVGVISCKKSKDHPSPVISSITPDNGVWSTIVTINGNNFSTNVTANAVQFNGKEARVVNAAGNVLTVEVPKGAGTGPVTVTVNGKTATGPLFNYTYITTVTTFAGSTSGYTDATGTAAQFAGPVNVCTDPQGNVYVADVVNRRIRKITATGEVSTFAGSTIGYADGTGAAARFRSPYGICSDAQGNIYVADPGNHNIRKITPAGVVSTLAGDITAGYADGSGTTARFDLPVGLCADAQGNIYVTDEGNNNIRKITAAGVVSTLAGSTAGTSGSAGYADGAGSAARFNSPYGICIDAQGNLYVAEGGNEKIRKITPAGVVTTLAGSTSGYADGTGAAAQFNGPTGITIDSQGNLYVSDYSNNKLRKVTPAGEVSTIAGSTPGYEDGSPFTAKFLNPYGICFDGQGNLYVADRNNYKIRKIINE